MLFSEGLITIIRSIIDRMKAYCDGGDGKTIQTREEEKIEAEAPSDETPSVIYLPTKGPIKNSYNCITLYLEPCITSKEYSIYLQRCRTFRDTAMYRRIPIGCMLNERKYRIKCTENARKINFW